MSGQPSPTPPPRRPSSIGPATRLNQALDLHPDVLPCVVALQPHDFGRLNNPVMRRLMSPLITLGRVASMAGVPVADLLGRISALTGVPVSDVPPPDLPHAPETAPAWVEDARREGVKVVDLLPLDDRLDADPMPPVMLAAKALQPGEAMVIHHRWEPQPFYDAWKPAGFEWHAEQTAPDEWHIWLRRPP